MASALSQIEAMKAMHIQSAAKSTANSAPTNRVDDDVEMEQKEDALNGGDGSVLSKALISEIEAMALELSKNRKAVNKAAMEREVSSERMASEYAVREHESYEAHNGVDRGIECIALSANEERVISGGTDSQIVGWNRSGKAIEFVLKGHSQTVNDIKIHRQNPQILMSASSDSTVMVWNLGKEAAAQRVWHLKGVHEAGVCALWQHPVNDLFLTASRDGMWCVHSLTAQKTWSKVTVDKAFGGINAFELHPDGQIVGVGCNDRMLRIWDIRSNQIGYSFEVGTAEIKRAAISFNPNGYILGYSDGSDTVNVWDLRKIAKQKSKGFLQRIQAEQTVRCIRFSPSGQYLAMGQPAGIEVFHGKKWNKLMGIGGHRKMVTDIQFADDSKFIVTASRDSKVRFIGSREQ